MEFDDTKVFNLGDSVKVILQGNEWCGCIGTVIRVDKDTGIYHIEIPDPDDPAFTHTVMFFEYKLELAYAKNSSEYEYAQDLYNWLSA